MSKDKTWCSLASQTTNFPDLLNFQTFDLIISLTCNITTDHLICRTFSISLPCTISELQIYGNLGSSLPKQSFPQAPRKTYLSRTIICLKKILQRCGYAVNLHQNVNKNINSNSWPSDREIIKFYIVLLNHCFEPKNIGVVHVIP